MKSKTLIEYIKEDDPSGEKEVCVDGRAIHFIESLPGYYDGHYCYVEDNEFFPKVFTISDKGSKIVIHTLSLDDYVNNDNEVILDIDNDRKEYFEKKIDKLRSKYKRFERDSLRRCLYDVIETITQGWKIVQPEGEIGQYNVMWYEKNSQRDKLNQGSCGAVINSGMFEHITREDNIIEWRLKI